MNNQNQSQLDKWLKEQQAQSSLNQINGIGNPYFQPIHYNPNQGQLNPNNIQKNQNINQHRGLFIHDYEQEQKNRLIGRVNRLEDKIKELEQNNELLVKLVKELIYKK